MAGGERGFGHKADNKYLEAEADTDMPILCEICLGDNPMVRMMKNSANGSYNNLPCTQEVSCFFFRWCLQCLWPTEDSVQVCIQL